MTAQDPKTYLWATLCRLAGEPVETAGIDQIHRKVKKAVGRGTIQRIKEGETSVGIDALMKLASAFGLEVWQLLVPGIEISHLPLAPWPFPMVAPARWGVCDYEDRVYVQASINEALRAREDAREKRRAPELMAAAKKSQAARLARANLADDPADSRAPIPEDLARDASGSDSDNVLAK